MNSRLDNKRGTTLIEILVTLVIIAIGIFSVVQLFSGGFVVLKRGENTTFAARLAEKEFERLRSRSDCLPLGITVLDGQPSTVPGLPLNQTNIYNIRQIIGETVKIPGPRLSAGSSGTVVGSVYQVAFAPVTGINAVYSSNLQRRVMDSSNSDNDPKYWLRPTQYAIDYDEQKICFRASPYLRQFNLSYSVWIKDSKTKVRSLRTVNNEVISVPANADWLEIKAGGQSISTAFKDFQEIDDRSDQVSRAFTEVLEFSSDDPYEYVVLDALLGRLAFNPIGYAYREDTPDGKKMLTAHIDYTVADWGVVAETLQVPESAPLRMRTTLRYIKQNGVTINDDGSLFKGIVNGAVDGIGASDLLIVDEATGDIVSTGGTDGAVVDYINGVIDFPSPTKTSVGTLEMAGRTVRVYYRADGDWRVLPQKAYERYTEQDNRGVSFREYYNADDSPNLYFNQLDAGKTFSVDYEWQDGNIERTVLGEVHRAEDGLDILGANTNAILRLNHPAYVVRAVRGVSLKVRVLWSEGSRVDDTGNIVNRWQHYEMDGELTRTVLAL